MTARKVLAAVVLAAPWLNGSLEALIYSQLLGVRTCLEGAAHGVVAVVGSATS